MGEDAQVLAVIDGLYGAVIDDSNWQTALGAVSTAFGASATLLMVSRREDMRPVFGRMSGIDPASWPEYADYYHSHDIGMERALRLPTRSVVTGGEILTREQLDRSEWYNDFLLRYDMQDFLAYLPEASSSLIGVMTIFRPVGAEPFSRSEKERLRAIQTHIDRVVALCLKLAETENALAAQSDVQDCLPFGLIFLDAASRIVRANRVGQELLQQQDGLRVRCGRLEAAHRDDRARLGTLIAEAVEFRPLDPSPSKGALAVRRPSGKRPYSLLAMPVSSRYGPSGLLGTTAISAVVFVTDPDASIELAETDLSCLFGLTPAEARVAAHVAGGESLATTASALGITVGTARNQLKVVMHKTGTHRQPELVGLLRSSVAAVADRNGGAPD